MKRILEIASVAMILGIALLFFVWPGMQSPDPDEPVALVNGSPIHREELQREVDKNRDQYALQNIFYDKTELKRLRKLILDHLIERELLWQQAVTMGLMADDEAVAAEREMMVKQYGNSAILNNMIRNRKISPETFWELIRKDLTIDALIEREISDAVAIEPEEMQAYYQKNIHSFTAPEQVRASQICIFPNSKDNTPAQWQAAKTAAEALRQRLRQGEAFEDLARQASDCATGERGGDLGYFTHGTIEPEIEEVAFSMQLEEVSPVIKTASGYQIIKVTGRQPARVLSFDEAQNDILHRLQEQSAERLLTAYIQRLRMKADITTHIK